MRLTEFIQKNRARILGEWVEFARSLHPWSKGLSEKALADHAAALLDAVVIDMDSSQSAAQQSAKSKGHGRRGALTSIGLRHASDRLETGFKLDQLVSEYRALRASVVRMWAESQGDRNGELGRFNESIDEILAEAAVEYSSLVNQTREQFLAILGHDLRNPLGAITMGASLLAKSESLDDREARVASRIVASAARMSRMINDLLDLARTRLGSMIPITPVTMDLTEVLQQVVSELEVVHPDRALRLETTGDLRGTWDSDRLTQVASNLVANALQYGQTLVRVVAEGREECVRFEVHNDGPAIAAAVMKNLFDPMVRAGSAGADRNRTGLGLGLYVAREIVSAHGGTVHVTSTDAEGTAFSVELPRRAAPKKFPGTAPVERSRPKGGVPRKKAAKGTRKRSAKGRRTR